jgi:hypothetical protein
VEIGFFYEEIKMTKPKDLELGQRLFIKTRYGVEIWKRIKASDARNSDGENAGYKPGTIEGDRVLLQKKFVPFDKSLPVNYTNYW